MKSYCGLAWLTVLWTRSTWAYGVVDTCAEGQRFGSSSRLCDLSYFTAVRPGQITVTGRGASIPLVVSVFAEPWGTVGLTSCRIGGYSVRLNQGLLWYTCIVRELQLRLYGHVARYPEVDPAHRLVLARDNQGWRRSRGRSQLSWLEQVDESCQELLRMGRGPAWRLARRNPRVWRRRIGGATRPPAYAPFDWLTDWLILTR